MLLNLKNMQNLKNINYILFVTTLALGKGAGQD